MSNKFSCPVSMQITREQYEKDLKRGLLDLGYREVDFAWNSENCEILCTNFQGVLDSLSNVWNGDRGSYNRYSINHYNPELFLALAGMREGEEPYPGEYFKVISDEMELYHLKKNHLYKVKHTDKSNNLTYGYLNKDYRKHLYRKATKEEIIDWFTRVKGKEIPEPHSNTPLTPQECYKSPSIIDETFEINLHKENFAPPKVLEEVCDEVNEPKTITVTFEYSEELKEFFVNWMKECQESEGLPDTKLNMVSHKFKDECYGYTAEAWEAAKPKYLEDSEKWVVANGLNTPCETLGYFDPYKAKDSSLEDAHIGSSSMTFGNKEEQTPIISKYHGVKFRLADTKYNDPGICQLYTANINPSCGVIPERGEFKTIYSEARIEQFFEDGLWIRVEEGFKDSKEKLNYELDWDFIEAMAKRMSSNKSIYPPYNWKKPMDIENLKQALFRHVIEIMKGNYDDDGMERAHFMSVALNAMMIDYQLRNNNNKTNE